jgi:hypothetical protein
MQACRHCDNADSSETSSDKYSYAIRPKSVVEQPFSGPKNKVSVTVAAAIVVVVVEVVDTVTVLAIIVSEFVKVEVIVVVAVGVVAMHEQAEERRVEGIVAIDSSV